MELDIEALIGPVSAEEPAGPDMYGDVDRQAIEQAFERAVDGDDGADAGVDWPAIISKIRDQAEVTRDLWLPVYLMRAAAKDGRLGLVVEGSQWLAALVEERWEDMHPQLDELGFIGRKTPCESLTRIGEFLAPLGQVPLLQHERLGSFSGADLQRFAEQGSSADGYGMFRAVLAEVPDEEVAGIVAGFDTLLDAIKRTDAVLTQNAEGDTATNFEPTYVAIGELRDALAAYLPEDKGVLADEVGEGAGDTDANPPSSAASGAHFSGGINSRADVERALDAICEYYARNEPSSPVPFALRRARDWISLDFIAVLEDIAPGSLGEAGQVLKSRRPSSDGNSWGNEDDSWGSSTDDSETPNNDDSWS